MKLEIKRKTLRIGGMTCANCQKKIQKELRKTAGIQSAEVSYHAGTAMIAYDTDKIALKDITAIIKDLDYEVLTGSGRKAPDIIRIIGLLAIIASLYFALEYFGLLNLLAPSQLAEVSMGYGMMFAIGLMTSVHCTAMCGGINLSQCIPKEEDAWDDSRFSALRPALLYNFGRVISYTAAGFAAGVLGGAFIFSNIAQGVLKLIAGLFMVIMGINILGIIPQLRRLNPGMPKIFTRRIAGQKANSKSPLIVGLLNGLMPCGPLQAMQIYALSTGSPLTGAFSMMLFSLGTVPLMFVLGAAGSTIGKKFTKKVMTAGAILVAALGLSMFSQGWILSGFTLPSMQDNTPAAGTVRTAGGSGESDVAIQDGVQVVKSTLASGSYPNITVQAGMPVKWVIDAPQGSINGCNNRMIIHEYGIEHSFQAGENIIEFTPSKAGSFRYSCWMGMIRGTIKVAETGADTRTPDPAASVRHRRMSIPANLPAAAVTGRR